MGKEIIHIGDLGGVLTSKLGNNFTEIYSGVYRGVRIISAVDDIKLNSFWTIRNYK
jgi:hypothetical protein